MEVGKVEDEGRDEGKDVDWAVFLVR